jgi:hypothetical protein
LRQTYHWFRKHFGHARWYPYVMWLMWLLVLVRLEIVLFLTYDRCTVCAKHTTDSKIVLDTPERKPR